MKLISNHFWSNDDQVILRETTELRSHKHVPFERLRNNGWCGADETGSLYSCDTSFTVDTTRRVLCCSLRISKLMIREEEEEGDFTGFITVITKAHTPAWPALILFNVDDHLQRYWNVNCIWSGHITVIEYVCWVSFWLDSRIVCKYNSPRYIYQITIDPYIITIHPVETIARLGFTANPNYPVIL